MLYRLDIRENITDTRDDCFCQVYPSFVIKKQDVVSENDGMSV